MEDTKENSRYEQSGFGQSLVGEQPYPPRTFKIKVSMPEVEVEQVVEIKKEIEV